MLLLALSDVSVYNNMDLLVCCLLQNAVSKNATQFRGHSQHDAQEFLLWLLDRVHEDLNTVNPNSRPSIKVK